MAEQATTEWIWPEHPLVDRVEGGRWRALGEEEIRRALAAGTPESVLEEYFRARQQRIQDAEQDPYRWEFQLPHWRQLEEMLLRKVVLFVPGGNNPGKTWWSASLVVRFLTGRYKWEGLMEEARRRVLMVAQDELSSKMYQQPAVYAHLPREWRLLNESAKKPAGFIKCLNYSDKNGFTEDSLVLPKPFRAQCWFKTVAQYTREPSSFEGPAYDLVVIDEGCPLGLFKTLLGRAGKVGGKVVYLLTALHGWDATLGQALDGATLVKSLPMQWDWLMGEGGGVNPAMEFPELRLEEHQSEALKRLGCPAGHMPFVMQPMNPHWGLMFLWNTWNPFQPPGLWRRGLRKAGRWWRAPVMPALFDACVGQPRWKVLVMLFGWVEKSGRVALGNFNPSVHVLRGAAREKLEAEIRAGRATIYFGDDPETQRSHAGLWLAVFPDGTKFIFDETPRRSEGEWVNANGERGDGQTVFGRMGSNWYKRHLRAREREWGITEVGAATLRPCGNEGLHERLVQRRGDPRGFATAESTATGTRNLFELFLEDASREDPDCYPMVFVPARIRRSSWLDLENIVSLLAYDEDRMLREGGLTAENRPKLYVSERCENFIQCALNYSLTEDGRSNEDDPHRDFIDAARYLFAMDTPYLDPVRSQDPGGGAWS